jgi:DNA (cytosine-5)-methyltransferase 1
MRFGSVCSGIEAASVAWEPLGWKAAWLSEIEPFANAVLAHRYPSTPNLGDVTKLKEREEYRESKIDVLVGGTPCQSFSVNGFRKGLRDPRGKLALAYCEIAQEKRPRWVVWENVPGVLSSNKGRDFGAFLGALGECGYRLAYRVLDARYYGVPQRRRRVFVVGHRGDYRAHHVLFDSEGGPWDAPPRQKEPETNSIAVKVPENLHVESNGDETAADCLLASGTGRNISAETVLIDEMLGVRRLMPLEWERLQGFPDDYTLVPYRVPCAELCPDTPRYKALGNSIAVPVLRWIGERIAAVDGLSSAVVTERLDPEGFVKTLTDSELVEKCVQGFRRLKEIVPYLRESRERFAQPGRRVPVAGNPTWTEWVEQNLGVTVRRVQQLLCEADRPHEIISPGSKQRSRELQGGDWRSLFKATERRTAKVFGSMDNTLKLARTIRNFAQALADKYTPAGSKISVSVSVNTHK